MIPSSKATDYLEEYGSMLLRMQIGLDVRVRYQKTLFLIVDYRALIFDS